MLHSTNIVRTTQNQDWQKMRPHERSVILIGWVTGIKLTEPTSALTCSYSIWFADIMMMMWFLATSWMAVTHILLTWWWCPYSVWQHSEWLWWPWLVICSTLYGSGVCSADLTLKSWVTFWMVVTCILQTWQWCPGIWHQSEWLWHAFCRPDVDVLTAFGSILNGCDGLAMIGNILSGCGLCFADF